MIIGISGKAQSGKDTIGNIILDRLDIMYPAISRVTKDNWQIRKFANKLKECVSIILGIPREDLEKEEVKQSRLPQYGNITVREFLQRFGTEIGRQIHNDTWVNVLMREYKGTDYPVTTSPIYNPTKHSTKYPNWIITDVRFPNEVKAIKDRGGIIIRVNRDIKTDTPNHISETVIDNGSYDYVIDNNGTIQELIDKVTIILINLKLI